ncbi:yjeF C-terminal region, hydroxyethylthiazole kinase-related/yjeF N-terminal region [Sphingomonas guangdongensis]|uniref:Bifunctional NAD(P)H-hydrate repair enzyme n=1 Tax=Sphingomonas guangdongensis TaxID=1141890 RepID=A0A285R0Z6_9SPHN|nr:NAD(P)H-hydrate epimerase [Sphingomonas guangdongensis]SOB87514.1 yjeF C-terminal region, hydroxyethylthiazole kinase-related/yjeF N-terminal region [Sphingomonas guangdongensis]
MSRLPAGAPIVTAAQMRAAEEAVFAGGATPLALMERAGVAVARQVARLAAGRPILVLAGTGGNGGDGYAAARLLREAGCDVRVASLGPPTHPAAMTMAARWTGPTWPLASAASAPVVVDALLGIGAARPFAAEPAAALDRLLALADLRIAVDLPSGRDPGTGEGGIQADVTIALGALKPAHVLGDDRAGHVLLADLSIPLASDWSTLSRPTLRPPRREATKFTRGKLVVVGGAMAGAGVLAASAALHGGAGYVILAEPERRDGAPHALVRRHVADASALATLLADDGIGAVLVGPGLGRDEAAQAQLAVVLASPHDLVIDGDALTLLGREVGARIGTDRRRVFLTPHGGEFSRMFTGHGSKIAATAGAAAASGATVIHKGPATVIADPSGRVQVAADASSWLASAGTGDVLAGLVAARLAAGDEHPAETAVWLHGRAAARVGAGLIADAMIPALSPLLDRPST